MNKQDFAQLLEMHDWYYERSEDPLGSEDHLEVSHRRTKHREGDLQGFEQNHSRLCSNHKSVNAHP